MPAWGIAPGTTSTHKPRAEGPVQRPHGSVGPLALNIIPCRYPGRCPGLAWGWGFAPQERRPIMKKGWETIGGIRLGEAAFSSANDAILRRQILQPHRGIRCQPGASPQEPHPPTNRGPKVRSNGGTVGPGLQPSILFHVHTQGVALGWLGDGALPRKKGDR